MLRYLSPAKICLVVLVEIYRTNEVRPSDNIALLSFIAAQIIPRSAEASHNNAPSPRRGQTLDDFQQLLAPITSQFPGRSLYDVFLRSLWSLESLEDLEQIFHTVRALHFLYWFTLTLGL